MFQAKKKFQLTRETFVIKKRNLIRQYSRNIQRQISVFIFDSNLVQIVNNSLIFPTNSDICSPTSNFCVCFVSTCYYSPQTRSHLGSLQSSSFAFSLSIVLKNHSSLGRLHRPGLVSSSYTSSVAPKCAVRIL